MYRYDPYNLTKCCLLSNRGTFYEPKKQKNKMKNEKLVVLCSFQVSATRNCGPRTTCFGCMYLLPSILGSIFVYSTAESSLLHQASSQVSDFISTNIILHVLKTLYFVLTSQIIKNLWITTLGNLPFFSFFFFSLSKGH